MKNKLIAVCILSVFFLGCSTSTNEYYYKNPDKTDLIRYTVFSDTHFFAGHGLNKLKLTYGPNTYYTGDIYDLKNADKDDASTAENAVKALRVKAGSRYIRGNHEIYAFGKGEKDEDYYVADNGIIFTHGHYKIGYKIEEVKKWESKKAGTGFMKRKGRKLLEGIVSKPEKPKKKYIKNAVIMVKEHNKKYPNNQCHTIVFGHTHVENIFTKTVDGIRIINVPRGISHLDL
ncbi:MAG: hypothetical protein GY749_05145 [Desulfobacteraceae bacterium]|nr:hypothetical protein [Desulfobacteraceae bacterium]